MKDPDWQECAKGVRTISDRYAIHEPDKRIIFDVIKDLPAASVIVEIGICWGSTSAVLAYVAKCRESEYHGIDLFILDGSSKPAVETSLAHLDFVSPLVTIHTGSSNGVGAHPLACPTWTKPIDVLLIDGGHDEINVKRDCEIWTPRVKSGGLVIFDDWTDGPPRSNDHWAIKYYSDKLLSDWDVLRTGSRIHIRRKP